MRSYLSPLDPIFWLHHNNIDRLWDSWLALGNSNASTAAFTNYAFRYAGQENNPPPPEYAQGDFIDESGARVAPRVRDVLSSAQLGYQFDNLRGLNQANVSRLVAERDRNALFSAATLSTRDAGFGHVATARFTLTRAMAAFSVGEASATKSSLGQLRQVFLQRAESVLDLNSPGTALVGRVVARVALREPLPPGVTAQVLINCPYLSSNNPADSPFFAGTLASFLHTDSEGHHDAGGHGGLGRTFTLDITDVLAEIGAQVEGGGDGSGGLTGAIDLQIVPSDPSLNVALESAQVDVV